MDPELFVIVNSERWWRNRSTSSRMATAVALHQDHRLPPRRGRVQRGHWDA